MKAINPRAPFPYVCEADRASPEAERTTFKLCALTFLERAALDDSRWQFNEDGRPQLHRGTSRRIALKCGLVGWDNLSGADGKPVPCVLADESVAGVTRQRPTDDSLERLDVAVQQELATAILDASSLSGADRKNS